MAPPSRKPAAFAAFGMLSPSSQAAWCGSPQAIWTRLMPRRSRKPFSSGMDFTWRDQLQTPTSSGFMARLRQSGCGFDAAAQRAEVVAVPPVLLVERAELVELQLGDFFRPGPDDGL